MQQQLMETVKAVWANEPKNYTGAAATKKWVSLKNYTNLTIVIITGAWAAGTAAVTVEQATAVAGTGNKAVPFTDYWDDEALSGALVKKAAVSNTFNLTTALKMYVIEIDARMLDIAGGFDCVALTVASPGANADFYGAAYILHGSRYQGAAQPSALVD